MLNLGDNKVLCGRQAKECMMRHCSGHSCPLVISFLDLSVWDHEQGCYLDMFNIKEIQGHFSWLHMLKFGEPATFPHLIHTGQQQAAAAGKNGPCEV